jgi:hypothetical protein
MLKSGAKRSAIHRALKTNENGIANKTVRVAGMDVFCSSRDVGMERVDSWEVTGMPQRTRHPGYPRIFEHYKRSTSPWKT